MRLYTFKDRESDVMRQNIFVRHDITQPFRLQSTDYPPRIIIVVWLVDYTVGSTELELVLIEYNLLSCTDL